MGLERSPLSLLNTLEELLGRKSRGSGLENREYSCGIRCADDVAPLYPQKLGLTLPSICGRSVGIVRSRTKATKILLVLRKVRTVTVPNWAFEVDA
jgi:hypothetical protein